MPRVRLSGGAYMARSIIAACQRSVNLFAEQGPAGAIIDAATGQGLGQPLAGGVSAGLVTLYPAPGLKPLTTGIGAPARGLYRANSDQLFYCAGSSLWLVNSSWIFTFIGSIAYGTMPVSMVDNGLALLLVDGTPNTGYSVDLTTLAFAQINATDNAPPVAVSTFAFPGADRVAMLDGYFLLNAPGTEQFYASYNVLPVGSGLSAENGLMFLSLIHI